MQVGEFLKINKHAIRNKCAGKILKKIVKYIGLNRGSVMMKEFEIQLSVVLKELEWFIY